MSQIGDVQDFVAQARRVRQPSALKDLIAAATVAMNFDYFALIHHVDLTPYSDTLEHMRRGRLVALSTYPDAWIENYIARGIVKTDPVLLASQHTNVGFAWSEVPKLLGSNKAARDLAETNRAAGFGDGFTVPAHVPCEANGSCNFVVRAGRTLPAANLAMAQLVGAFAFQAARQMVINAEASGQPPRTRPLTDRQIECLILVGRGRTEREIAATLGIAEETVKRHLKDARIAHEVGKSVQVLMRALFQGEIALIDVIRD